MVNHYLVVTYKENNMIIKTKQEVEEKLREYESLIPAIYEAGAFPNRFALKPSDWALSKEEIERPSLVAFINGERKSFRPIATMDLEFLSNATIQKVKDCELDLVSKYPCGLKCPGCFSQEGVYGDRTNLMTWQQVMDVVVDARLIGLKSTKFLGPGEMFQNPDLFDILDAFEKRGLPISIFTKGSELGSDELAVKNFGNQGIKSAKGLVNIVSKYECVRILLGFNSFFSDRQDRMVGSSATTRDYQITDGAFTSRGVTNYTEKRNQALVNLVEVGFNNPNRGQRLSLIAAPVSLEQIDEIPSMYVWAAKRNIPLVIAPTMESGPKSIGLSNLNKRIDPNHEKLVQLMTAVYDTAIENGIMPLEQIRNEEVSAYMGTSPCNQVANGLYLRLNGRIQMCPGRSDSSAIYGNIHQTPLAEIWVNSPNYRMGAKINNWCTAKTEGRPKNVQTEVLRRLVEKYQK